MTIRSILVSAALIVLSVVPRTVVRAEGISEKQFNDVLDLLEVIYKPEIEARGGRLVISRLWENEDISAQAILRSQQTYQLLMFGGLARHPLITQDAMALVACHELGHLIGGAPRGNGGNRRSSLEAQADYFANLKCMRRILSADGAASFTRPRGDDAVPRAACEQSFKSDSERAVCVRSIMAGMTVATVFHMSNKETGILRFDTPDQAVVAETDDAHLAAQCRLDTFIAGALCDRAIDDQVDAADPAKGACTAASGHKSGLRPLCWYKPSGEPAVPVWMTRPKTPAVLSSLQNQGLWQGL